MPGKAHPQQEQSTATVEGAGPEAEVIEEEVEEQAQEEQSLLEQFQEALDDPDSDGPWVLSWVAWAANSDMAVAGDILGDSTMLAQMAGILDASQMTAAMRYLQAPLTDAVAQVQAAGGLTADLWGQLVAGRTAEDCLEVVLDSATLAAIIATMPSSAVEQFPALALQPALFAEAVAQQPLFLPWITLVDGILRVAEILDRLAEYAVDEQLRNVMVYTGTFDTFLGAYPEPTVVEREARRLYNWLLQTDSLDEGMLLFKKRFGIELLNQAAAEDDESTEEDESRVEANWDLTSIVRVWQICATLPPEQAATAVTILREGEEGGAGGWADADNNIGMEWGTDQMGSTEVGAFTEDNDPMRGLNVFDATMRHEIGHTVGATQGFDADGGFVWTVFGWQEEEQRPLIRQVFAPAYSLGDAVSDEEEEFAIRGLAQAAAMDLDSLKASVDAVAQRQNAAGLWDKIVDSELVEFILERSVEEAWNAPAEIDGRSYHMDYPPDGTWVSCPMDRYANKVSNYAMRSPAEWFAEVYAVFYADADRPGVDVGSTLSGRDAQAYQHMLTEVHTLWNIFEMTGQEMGRGTMGV